MSEYLERYRIQAQFYGWDDARLERSIDESNQERQRLLVELENADPLKALSTMKVIDSLTDAMAKMLCELERRRYAARTVWV